MSRRGRAATFRRLEDRAEIQLHGLPHSPIGPAVGGYGSPALSKPRLEGPGSSASHQRGSSRRSKLADQVPHQSGAQRYGHESEWRAALPEDQNAHFPVLAGRSRKAGEIL